MGSLAKAVAVVLHRQIKYVLVDFGRKDRVVKIHLTNNLILQIHNFKRRHDSLQRPTLEPGFQLYFRFLRTIR